MRMLQNIMATVLTPVYDYDVPDKPSKTNHHGVVVLLINSSIVSEWEVHNLKAFPTRKLHLDCQNSKMRIILSLSLITTI